MCFHVHFQLVSAGKSRRTDTALPFTRVATLHNGLQIDISRCQQVNRRNGEYFPSCSYYCLMWRFLFVPLWSTPKLQDWRTLGQIQRRYERYRYSSVNVYFLFQSVWSELKMSGQEFFREGGQLENVTDDSCHRAGSVSDRPHSSVAIFQMPD